MPEPKSNRSDKAFALIPPNCAFVHAKALSYFGDRAGAQVLAQISVLRLLKFISYDPCYFDTINKRGKTTLINNSFVF